jgi:hypothetical protein
MIAIEESALHVTIPLSAKGSEVQSAFIPDHILAFLACHRDVQSAIAVDVDEADLICRLVFIEPMPGEAAPGVVFKPGQNPRVLGADREIGLPVAIDVAGRQPVRSDVSGIDLVRFWRSPTGVPVPQQDRAGVQYGSGFPRLRPKKPTRPSRRTARSWSRNQIINE